MSGTGFVGNSGIKSAQCRLMGWRSEADRARRYRRVAFPVVRGVEFAIVPEVEYERRLADDGRVAKTWPDRIDAELCL